MVFGCNALECVSMNNQISKVRPEILHINSNEPLFYPYNILAGKWSGRCNNINDPYAKLCIPDFVKTQISKCLILCQELMKHISQYESCT